MRNRLIPVSTGKPLEDIKKMYHILREAGEAYVSL